MKRRIPRYTHEGVQDATVSEHYFATEDGLGLELTRFHRADSDDVVLLVHGLTSGSDIFIMPEHTNLVSRLLDDGFTDVWAVDFRMSNRFPYDVESHRYTLDDIALFDHPAALRELRRHVGDRRVHVIAHCLGSVSFSMSLFAGTVSDIASLTCNSVSLTPRVPAWSRHKLRFAPPFAEYVLGFSHLDPYFAEAPPFTRGWLLSKAISMVHRECDVPACHMQSFMWGSGKPAMYEHANLLPVTHERMADLCGAAGFNYYRHVNRMIRAGHAVKHDPGEARHAALPDDYTARMAEVETPILFLTGDRNRVFPEANVVCHRMLERVAPGRHELEIFPGYGHLDTIVGKNADLDVFPHILDFLKRRAV